jgi:hypothetical protein
MREVRVIKKEKPISINVRVKQRKSKRWSAWIDGSPSITAGGKTAMAAVGHLVRKNPELFKVVIVLPEEKQQVEQAEG